MNPALLPIYRAITPLRLIFWGVLLVLLDFRFSWLSSTNGGPPSGIRIDILSDVIGYLLIAIAVWQLNRFEVSSGYRAKMRLTFACVGLNVIEAFFDHFIFQVPIIFYAMSSLLGLLTLAVSYLFCSCMSELAGQYSLERSRLSWDTTRQLVLVFWIIPFGLLGIFGLLRLLSGNAMRLDLGLLGVALLIIALIPLIHFFVSVSRMRREAAKG